MAFSLRALENRGGSTGFARQFSYTTATDNKAAVKAANYFNGGASQLQAGDRLFIFASDASFDAKVVSVSAAGVVVIAAVDTFV